MNWTLIARLKDNRFKRRIHKTESIENNFYLQKKKNYEYNNNKNRVFYRKYSVSEALTHKNRITIFYLMRTSGNTRIQIENGKKYQNVFSSSLGLENSLKNQEYHNDLNNLSYHFVHFVSFVLLFLTCTFSVSPFTYV